MIFIVAAISSCSQITEIRFQCYCALLIYFVFSLILILIFTLYCNGNISHFIIEIQLFCSFFIFKCTVDVIHSLIQWWLYQILPEYRFKSKIEKFGKINLLSTAEDVCGTYHNSHCCNVGVVEFFCSCRESRSVICYSGVRIREYLSPMPGMAFASFRLFFVS